MDNEAELLWEWLPATITSRQDAAPTEKSQLPRHLRAEKRLIRPSAKARGVLESAAYRKICEHLQNVAQRRITA
jgi:hypothetical protein